MVSLATETDRTLFFDFLPLDLGTVRGFRDALPSVYRSRTGFLRGEPPADFEGRGWRGICGGFAGRAAGREPRNTRQPARTSERSQSGFRYDSLRAATQQARPSEYPAGGRIAETTQRERRAVLEAVAVTGQGVFDTLKEVAKLVLAELKKNA